VNLDYLVGRKVISIDASPPEGDWAIVFDDATQLIHTGDTPVPDSVIEESVLGSVQINNTKSVLEFYQGSPPDLVSTLVGTTDTFAIEWAENSVMENITAPERTDPVLDLPRDPSPERVATSATGDESES
jgi:hypothetical protein